ncbi:MAG: histidine kinase [Paenibacillus sp.]|jgi:two-component system sensor histidine kinase LytS|uniref:LytS/YhcK type 5TM receptor domain-containing protein n=1 Tax=Paenibacillus sp. GCM10012303 TaxID=3317340 RepID=UPI0029E9C706|nr:histidine kinase [Paenibacillus sp.]
MISLLPLMLERVGILLIVAILLSRLKSFRNIVNHEDGVTDKIRLIVIFGAFGVISNYTGVEIRGGSLIASQAWQTWIETDGAIANTRIMGVVIGGLIGGPVVGTGVGLIAGLHRFTLGGFTAVACGMSSILAGIATGYLGKRIRLRESSALWRAVVIGLLMECTQMATILLVARPFDAAAALVEVIAVPMIFINGFGTLLFMLIIQSIIREETRTRAHQTQLAFTIADQTLPFFRQGLNPHSCREAAEIIRKQTNADAISITDRHHVLAHIGAGSDHHVALQPISTQLTRQVLEEGSAGKAVTREQIQCSKPDCVLQAAIVLPLKVLERTVGTLKLYYKKPSRLDQAEEELAEGLSRLFSTQLELAEAERQRRLLKDAEIKALQAQVHPHFLFNAFNTISALCRMDPEKARTLLQQLSVFFRSNLQGARQTVVPLYKELEHVRAYLSLEQARFPDKYSMRMEIDPALEEIGVPPFTLQPLVENALKYAFPAHAEPGRSQIMLRAYREQDKMVLVTEDNGRGIPGELLAALGSRTVESLEGTGTALYNICKRIDELYGSEGDFRIESKPGAGTTVTIRLPIHHSHWGETHVESFDRG